MLSQQTKESTTGIMCPLMANRVKEENYTFTKQGSYHERTIGSSEKWKS